MLDPATSNGSRKSEMTLTFLGCGNLGIAILGGVLAALTEARNNPNQTQSSSEDLPSQTPTKFIACVRRSAKRIQDTVVAFPDFPVKVLQNDNVTGVREGDVIILGCKQYMIKDLLDVPGMREALKGKLLITILAGVPEKQIEDMLYPDDSTPVDERCRVVRALPNTAAFVRESMTVIGTPNPPLPDELNKVVNWIFTRIGRVVHLPSSNMDACTALAGSSPAFFALAIEGVTDGAVAMGMPRADAQLMAAQAMKGAADLILNGEHPAILKEKVSSPGGCTIGGLLVLEENAVRGSYARSIREATVVASQLGQGVKNVNGFIAVIRKSYLLFLEERPYFQRNGYETMGIEYPES
ncbi:pyrroline-5-carboxylate reductase [Paecilomyces variotii No. 5]|uniref:Pyrroline-5-carboxylate reductase n=1 Tax=Byssochlamys spectabilis (strain No. 5 / NBRC 109023) TaxID=1356009 RepID=V5HXD3_BYSSN|nr:pyrroline-5-carboxylate reductase [Paecilomyces variotii No. 5]